MAEADLGSGATRERGLATGDLPSGKPPADRAVNAPSPRVFWAWLWVAACVAVIWTFSGDSFSARETSRFLTPFIRWLYPDVSHEFLRTAHGFVRKSAHLFEYAVLALLSFRALRLTLDVSLARVGLLTLLLVLAVSGIDEARQALIPTRTGSLGDVALDFAGGALGVAGIVALHRWLGIGAPVARPREGA